MRRGEIWTLAGGLHYAGKPRPAVILQDNRFDATDSITVAPFTTDTTEADIMRPPIQPTETNGLLAPCRLMIDKIVTVPKDKLGRRIGRLDPADLTRVGRAVVVFLGVADVNQSAREIMRWFDREVRALVLSYLKGTPESSQVHLRMSNDGLTCS